MPNLLKTFRERLYSFLEIRGNAQLLHEKTGISRSMLDRYKKGDAAPGIDTVDVLAKAMGISPGELLGLTEDVQIEHPIEECYRRIGERIRSPIKKETPIESRDEMRLRVLEALKIVKEWYLSAPPVQQGTFLEDLKKKASHDK